MCVCVCVCMCNIIYIYNNTNACLYITIHLKERVYIKHCDLIKLN